MHMFTSNKSSYLLAYISAFVELRIRLRLNICDIIILLLGCLIDRFNFLFIERD